MNATQNIALYCASAILEDFPDGDYIPPFPPAGERGANSDTALTATVEPWRKLTYINMWQLDKFDEATQQAFANSMNVPTWDLQVPDFDSKTRSIITMAAGPQFTVPPNHLPLPEGVQGVREWIYHLPLRTAERVMKLINPDSSNWALDINQASNQLSHLYTTCAWGPRRETPTATTNGFGRVLPNLLFVVQSPWLLGPADFRMFCERSMYRHYAKKNPKTGKVETTELDYVDKLWATIYDDCVRGNTHYFILTTYNEWSFGAFSRGWTTAWTTPPKPYNSGSPELPGPTILQSILFWMHSSQQFYYDSYRASSRGRYGSFVDEDGSGLPTPISPGQSLADDEEELDLASETDDNTLDKGWLNEMRTSMREIKDLKGAKRTLGAATGSWVIPEVSADYNSWRTYESEFRTRAGVDAEDWMEIEDKPPRIQSWDFLRPCTIAELGAGGNMAAAMAIAMASQFFYRRHQGVSDSSRLLIWEDMEPPKPPPKRPNPLYSIDEDPRSEDGWYNKRQRPNDEHVTTRRARPAPAPAPQRRGRTPHPQRPQTSATTQDASSIQANSSVSTAKTSSTRVLPGGFPSGSGSDGSAWSPWLSETSPVKILWSRTFMSVRTTLADALRRLLRTKEEQVPAANAGSLPATPAPQPHQPQQRQQRPRARPAPELPRRAPEMERFTFNSDSIPEVDENRLPSLAPAPALPIGFSLPQTTVALGGHTITLNPAPRARLMSGIQLEQPVPTQQSWPPPRRPFMPLFVEAPESASDATEIDPDAQRRPECGVPVYEGFY